MSSALDYVIDAADIASVNVASQPTVLRGTAAQNKQVFDNYSNLIASRFNSLCAFVDSDTSAEVAASVQAIYANLGWIAD